MISFLFSLILSAQAQVTTAPFSPDQRLVNPAVAPLRAFKGSSFSFNRDVDLATLSENNTVETMIDTYTLGVHFTRGTYSLEFSLLTQLGTKTSAGSISVGGAPTYGSERTISLVPLEISAAKKIDDWLVMGVKLVGTSAEFSTNDQSDYSYAQGSIERTRTTGYRKDLFLAPSLGGIVTYKGFAFGGSAEFLTFDDTEDSVTSRTLTSATFTETSQYVKKKSGTTSLRKDVLGAGYSGKFGGNNTFRVDVSRSIMPAPNSHAAVNTGTMDRLVTEATWTFFQAGMEMTNQQGAYIDATNLIPYFFNEDTFTNDSVFEYRFFGGFKTSKGHSLGLSFSESKKTKMEPQGSSGQKGPVEHKYTNYSLSYMYVF